MLLGEPYIILCYFPFRHFSSAALIVAKQLKQFTLGKVSKDNMSSWLICWSRGNRINTDTAVKAKCFNIPVWIFIETCSCKFLDSIVFERWACVGSSFYLCNFESSRRYYSEKGSDLYNKKVYWWWTRIAFSSALQLNCFPHCSLKISCYYSSFKALHRFIHPFIAYTGLSL